MSSATSSQSSAGGAVAWRPRRARGGVRAPHADAPAWQPPPARGAAPAASGARRAGHRGGARRERRAPQPAVARRTRASIAGCRRSSRATVPEPCWRSSPPWSWPWCCSRSDGSASCASPAGSGRTCSSSCGAACSRTSSGSTSPSTTGTPPAASTSRLTSDVDAITELLAGGFDGLVTRRADHGRRRHPDADPRPRARTRLPVVLPAAGAARALVRAYVGGDLPQGPRGLGPGDRAVRRDDDRRPGGPGLPPRAAQRRDLR